MKRFIDNLERTLREVASLRYTLNDPDLLIYKLNDWAKDMKNIGLDPTLCIGYVPINKDGTILNMVCTSFGDIQVVDSNLVPKGTYYIIDTKKALEIIESAYSIFTIAQLISYNKEKRQS